MVPRPSRHGHGHGDYGLRGGAFLAGYLNLALMNALGVANSNHGTRRDVFLPHDGWRPNHPRPPVGWTPAGWTPPREKTR